MGDSELSQTTHVVVDEVHERSVDSDLLLLLLRDLAARRRDLQIVLMSATADADMFSDYFRKVRISLRDSNWLLMDCQHLLAYRCQPNWTIRL